MKKDNEGYKKVVNSKRPQVKVNLKNVGGGAAASGDHEEEKKSEENSEEEKKESDDEEKETTAADKMDKRFKDTTIEYKATQDIPADDTVSIMGEFNNWLPEGMYRKSTSKDDGEDFKTFNYTTKLLKGFKYRYVLLVGEQIIHDENSPHSEDSVGRMTNHVAVAKDDDLADAVAMMAAQQDKEVDQIDEAELQSTLLFNRYGSYINTGVGQYLAKDVREKIGQRVYSEESQDLSSLLKKA